jgi:catalase
MAKVRLVPASPELRALTKAKIDLKGKPNGIRDAVIGHFAKAGGRWELQVQLCTDIEKMPLEDATKEWSQKDSPYVTVARIEAQPQNVWSAARQTADHTLAFNPWHALAAHRPLGGIMRVRRQVYRLTAELRAQRNGQPLQEPASAADLTGWGT